MNPLNHHNIHDVAIVGTGLHGMHLYIRLGADGGFTDSGIATIDPWDTPLHLWRRRTSNTTMEYLRSPASHGLHPRFPTIRRFQRTHGEELPDGEPFTPPYHRPSLALFNRHGEYEIARAGIRRHHITGVVTEIGRKDRLGELHIRRRDGGTETVTARSIVLAPGQPPPCIPTPFRELSDRRRISHIYATRFPLHEIASSPDVAIIGGGIAAIHLALYLSSRNKPVDLWCPHAPETYHYDSDPCYIGPGCGTDFREIPSYTRRRSIISAERRNGSVPPDLAARRRESVAEGRIRLIPRRVTTAESDGTGVRIGGDEPEHKRRYSHVVLATGFTAGPPAAGLISRTAKGLNLPLGHDGYPIVTEELRWSSGDTAEEPPIYCMGALAELEIGPPSRNIIGAHLAGRRIVPALKSVLGTVNTR